MPSNATSAARAKGCANVRWGIDGAKRQPQHRDAKGEADLAHDKRHSRGHARLSWRGKSQDDPRQLRVRQCGADADDGHAGDRGGKT